MMEIFSATRNNPVEGGQKAMFDSSQLTGTMLIQSLIELYRDDQIELDELWAIIEREMRCQKFDRICVGYEPACACSQSSAN